MKNSNLTAKLLLTALLTAPLLVACQKGDQGRPTSDSTPPGTSLPTSVGDTSPGGTTDSGGGNGVGNRVFEAYIIDPIQLPAYQVLRPFFEKWKENIGAEHPGTSSKALGPEYLFKVKTWYIAPVDLKPIGNSVIGLHFSELGTEQLAIQTDKEVWINQSAWEKMSLKDQGTLLLHEYVMNLYLWKFEKFSSFCAKVNEVSGENSCQLEAGNVARVDEVMPPEPKRPLNAEDYANIRRITAWILEIGSQVTGKQFQAKLLANGFDKRFFRNQESPDFKSRKISVSAEMLKSALLRMKVLGRMPTECRLANSGETIPCQIDVKFEEKPVWEEIPTPKLHASFTFQTPYSGQITTESSPIFDQSEMNTWYDNTNGEEAVSLTIGGRPKRNPKLGEWHTPVFMVATPRFDEAGVLTTVDIKAVALLRLKISEISADGKTCRAENPLAQSKSEESIMASASGFNANVYLSYITGNQSMQICY